MLYYLFSLISQGQLPLPDKKESEKLYRRISDYFQNKGNETNIDSLLDQIQNEHNIDEFFKNQPKPSEGFSQENQQNIDPNLAYSQFQMQPESFEAKRRGRQRRSALNPMEEAEYGGSTT